MKSHHDIPLRRLGDGLAVSAMSFGAMGMSEFYGPAPSIEDSLKVLNRALELGVTMIDTADMYGRGHNEQLISRFLALHPAEYKSGRIQIATKFGIDRDPVDIYKRSINNSPEYIQAACEASLRRLGIERIDLYYAHRIAPQSDIAATVGAMADLKTQGKIAHIGLCEVSPATLEKAHAIHPITALQSEYSLWTREVEREILPICRRLGVGFVAYSPLGRGFLTGKVAMDSLAEGDFRRSNPRFQGENLERNAALLPTLRAIAAGDGHTPAQIALAWLLRRYEHLAVIPGTRSIPRLEENCSAIEVRLHPDDIRKLDAAFTADAVHGERYTQEGMKGANA